MITKIPPHVSDVFDKLPSQHKDRLLKLRNLILETAKDIEDVGSIEEDLRWGEPSYITSETKSGSTIRLGLVKDNINQYGIFFNCKTTLISTFKEIYGDLFKYQKNRAILFDINDQLPVKELQHCIYIALTYNLNRKIL